MATHHVFLNPGAGSAQSQTGAQVKSLFKELGLSVTVHEVATDLVKTVQTAAAQPDCQVLIAMGGDGTVSAVAGVAYEAHKTLGVIPAGTLNHFARDLGLPSDLAEAINIIASGRTTAIDIVRLDDLVVINNLSLGVYPQLVRRRERRQSQMGKWPALVVELASLLRRPPRRRRYHLTYDGTEREMKTPFIFVGNNDYHTTGGGLGGRTSLTGGRLSLFVYRQRQWWRLAIELMKAFSGRPTHRTFMQAHPYKITIAGSRQPVAVAHDGEVTPLKLPLDIRLEAQALKVRVPSSDKFSQEG